MTDATSAIVANHNPLVDPTEMVFKFRKTRDESGVETKRPDITTKIGVLSIEGIIKVLEKGGKELELLQSAVREQYENYIKSILGDDDKLSSDNFPADSITWEAIANQPESERKGRGIAKEIWEDFIKSYLSFMPGLTGKTEEQVKRQAAILAQKLNPLKNHEKKEEILPKFKEQLSLYLNNSPEAEQFAECVEFLLKKADSILNADKESNLAENLGFE